MSIDPLHKSVGVDGDDDNDYHDVEEEDGDADDDDDYDIDDDDSGGGGGGGGHKCRSGVGDDHDDDEEEGYAEDNDDDDVDDDDDFAFKNKKEAVKNVSKMLTEDHKLQRVEISQCLLLRCQHDNGDEDTTLVGVGLGGDFQAKDNLFDNLITGDETWIHLNTPETKRDSMTWKHPSSPVTKKFKVQRSAVKLMATVFWDARDVIL
ncbi:histone-lysine N-methyltransferase SETMAR [Elysia marginata]|uniref:Histone-lysine N-methyltransferase SETMAR n=1 Tax=Elysia marginata TaxID=1093978 RepID=A0AAV4H9C7_9GAST|nr:histone-lysine N-methyltransferase SETMAR [Elysia marginata]